jgi:adenylate cyclase
MALEIERKYLVNSDRYKSIASKQFRITQGYLSSNPECTVRIRIKGENAYITIKGIANSSGLTRFEWEKEIPIAEAEELLALCEPGAIDKTRFEVRWGQHTIEIDEFYGDNQGLTVAEVELASEDDLFEKPDWLVKEVTGDPRYYNSELSKRPYRTWG